MIKMNYSHVSINSMIETLCESLAVRVTASERREFEVAAAAKNMRPSVALRLAMSQFVESHRADSCCPRQLQLGKPSGGN